MWVLLHDPLSFLSCRAASLTNYLATYLDLTKQRPCDIPAFFYVAANYISELLCYNNFRKA